MSEAAFQQIVATMDERQLLALRISIAAERRRWTQPMPQDASALKAAYGWARENVR